MFDVHSVDTVYIELKTKTTTNETLQIIFDSNVCDVPLDTANMTIDITTPITIIKQTQYVTETIYCTQYANYDLSLNWTFWIYWDNNQLLIGNGRQIGNGIIYRLRDDFTVNAIYRIAIASITESQWTFYSMIETLRDDNDIDAYVINRESELFCKRYYTHSNSKSQISKLNTMINDHFVAFSVKCSTMDNAPQIYLSYWNTQKNANNNNNDFNIDNHWWFSIELQIAKQQMFVANNSENQVAVMVLPSKFRIKDDVTNCYLDITFGAFVDENNIRCCRDHGLYNEEMNLFWNCDGNGNIWRYDDKTKRIYYKEFNLYLIFGERGSGLQIGQNDRNAKVSPYTIDSQYGTDLTIKQSIDERYRISFNDPNNVDNCQLARSDTQYVYKTLDGKACFGYEAKFKCDASGVDIKLIIASLAGIKMNDWTSIWMTSFGNDNIKIGIGDLIGNDEDVVFSFDYEYLDYNILYDSLQYIWIDSAHATNWIFYDYDTSTICDAPIVKAYNVSKQMLTYNIDYTLPAMAESFVPRYLWNDQYLMFNISSHGDVWIKFEMKTDDVFIVEYGKDSVKDLCDDTRGITDHVVIMKNSQYKYCSPYAGYDLSLTYLFWIYWNDNKLEIGNGHHLGQSVITAYTEFNHHQEIESISIGSDNDNSIWRFYTIQKHFTLNNVTFAPNDVLSFSFKYDKLGILQKKANVSIISLELNIKYVLIMNFENEALCRICDANDCVLCDYKEGGIRINVPDYKYIRMHQTFDSEYLIKISSNDLLLAESEYILKRKNFMNVTIHFDTDLTVGSMLRILGYDINNNEITQNSSSITLTCLSLGIDAKILINYATDSCLICVNNDNCNICYIGIRCGSMNDTEQINNKHILSIQSDDTYLALKRIEINVHPCDIGYGLRTKQRELGKECTLCPANHFNLDATDNECYNCLSSTDFNRIGYECKGSSNVLVDYNWWIVMSGYSNGWQYIFEDNHTVFDIISSICPPLFCCQKKEGCLYYDDEYRLCAENRDPNIALCGGCIEGYSEVYGSTSCKECNEDHYIYLLIGLLIGLLYAVCISFVIEYNGDNIKEDSYTGVIKQIEQFNYSKLVMNDSICALLISLFRPMTYFYQSMAYLLMNYHIMPFVLMCALQIFAIDLSINSDDTESALCFVSGLTALSKEVWLLFIPFCLFISIGIIWMVLQCGASSYLWKRYRVKYSPNLLGMVWSALLLSMTTMLSRLFKIAACTSMASLSYIHFYASQHECFDEIWYLAVIGIIMIIAFWTLVWYKLYNMGITNRRQTSSLHHESIISPYKDRYWYWEFVLTLRRMLISALITFKYINQDYFNLILGGVLLIYLILHFKIQPFKHKRINNMESLCLLLLICCFAVINFASDTFISLFISITLLFPFALFMTRIYSTIKLFCSMKYSEGQLDENQQETLLKVINRLHESQRDLIKAIMHRRMPHIIIPSPKNDDHDDIIDDEMTYFHSNSPGAMPRLHRKITEITPTISTSVTVSIVNRINNHQTKGEESESLTPSNHHMVPPPPAYTVSSTYSQAEQTTKHPNCIMDYHKFVHKIETKEDSSTLYDDSGTVDVDNNDDDQKYEYPLDGPIRNSSKSDVEITLQLIDIMVNNNNNEIVSTQDSNE